MTKILTIIAHPDDETMLSGGALVLLARAGAQVHYLCATRGEGGEVGEPPVSSREALGVAREREMRCAVETLGGAGVEFLNYVDPLVGENDELHPYTDDFDGLVAEILDHMRILGPDVVITHGSSGEYGHPAHKLTHKATRKAVKILNEEAGIPAPMLYTFSADFPGHPRPRLTNQDDPAHIVLDVTPALQQKAGAALCHKSQHALFVRRSSIRAGRQLSVPEVVMQVEGLHRVYPAVNGAVDDVVVQLLRPWEITKA
jgi:LmbE family N-acetylglucosaminyl deacetylase